MADQRLPFEYSLPEVLQAPVPGDNGPPAPAFAPPPVNPPAEPNLISLLTALGGLGLNVAGASSGSGAAGNQALSTSQHIYDQQIAQQTRQQANDTLKYKADRQAQISESLSPMRSKLPASERAAFDAYLEAGEDDKARSMIRDQRYYDRLGKGQEKTDYIGIKGAINSHIKSLDDHLKDRETNPEIQARRTQVEGAAKLGQFYANQQGYFDNPEALRNAINQNPKAAGFASKIDLKSAQAEFEKYHEFIGTKKVPSKNKLLNYLGMKSLPDGATSQKLFSDYAEKTLGPDAVQKLRSDANSLQDVKYIKERTRELNELHEAPKTRLVAQDIYNSGLLNDPPPPKVSWPDWYEMSPELREKVRTKHGQR